MKNNYYLFYIKFNSVIYAIRRPQSCHILESSQGPEEVKRDLKETQLASGEVLFLDMTAGKMSVITL